MLVAGVSNGDFIVGLDAENISRLQKGEVIEVKLSEMGGNFNVVIMAGKTLDDVKTEIETGLGVKLPEPTKPGKRTEH